MTDYPVAPPEESGALDRFKKRTYQIPVEGVVNADAPTVDASLTDAELIQAIESLRLQDDLLVIMRGGTTAHMIVGDVKKIGIWSIVTFVIKILSAKFF